MANERPRTRGKSKAKLATKAKSAPKATTKPKRATPEPKRTTPARKAAPRKKLAPKAAATTRSPRTRLAASQPGDMMAEHVAAALRLRGLDDSPEVVATVTAVGFGYRQGPAADPGFLQVALDIDRLVAEALVERFADGTPPAGIDRDMHRTTVRSTVNVNLVQLGEPGAGETTRRTLTSLALGSWRPGLDEHGRRNALASFLVAWYRAGRS